MTYFFMALLTTATAVALPGFFAAALTKQRPRAFTGATVVTVVFFVLNWLLMYFGMPTAGFGSTVFWFSSWWMALEAIITAIVVGAVAYSADEDYMDIGAGPWIAGVLAVLMIVVQMLSGVWTDDRAKFLAHQIKMTVVDTKLHPTVYPDSDTAHLILLSEDMAVFKAKNAMNQATAVTAGSFQGNLSTAFELDVPVIQSVGGHAFYEFGLKPSGYQANGSTNGNVPAYMEVDAENPDATPTLYTKDANGKAIDMQYYPGGYFGHNIDRLIWSRYPNRKVTDVTIEINDQHQPFFTASLDQLTLNSEATVPEQLLIIDPTTGNITAKDLNNVPDFVDRVISGPTAVTEINWWGEWNSAPWQINESPVNRYKISEDSDGNTMPPTPVYTTSGHPKWQSILTSYNSDTSASFLVLADARDNKAEAYSVPGLTLESVAQKTMEGSAKNVRKLHIPSGSMTLHKIYGVLTWVAPMVSESNNAFQALALMNATDSSGSSVAINVTKSQALEDYILVAHNTGNSGQADSDANLKTTDGVIDRVSPPMAGGSSSSVTTSFNFMLVGDTHLYTVKYDSGATPESSFIFKGDKVRLSYEDTGSILRVIKSYDNLGLALAA